MVTSLFYFLFCLRAFSQGLLCISLFWGGFAIQHPTSGPSQMMLFFHFFLIVLFYGVHIVHMILANPGSSTSHKKIGGPPKSIENKNQFGIFHLQGKLYFPPYHFREMTKFWVIITQLFWGHCLGQGDTVSGLSNMCFLGGENDPSKILV